MSRSEGLKGFWLYMWQLHRQTKNVMKLNFSAKEQMMLAESEEERKEPADKTHYGIDENEVLPGGDRSPKEGMDVSHDYGPRQRIGLFLGPLLFLSF